MARLGAAWQGVDWPERQGKQWTGWAWSGTAGAARIGGDRRVRARRGVARQEWLAVARCGKVCKARA